MATTLHYNLTLPDPLRNISEEFLFYGVNLQAIDGALHTIALSVSGKASATHGHALGDVTGLVEALNGKMAANATFKLDDLTDVSGADGAANGYLLVKSPTGWVPSSALAALGTHGHLIAEVTGLADALATFATTTQLTSAIDTLKGGVSTAFDTLAEIAAVLPAKQNIADRGILAGQRNKIINHRFEFTMRATSTSVAGYFCDRWKAVTFGTGAAGQSAAVSAFNNVAYPYGRRNLLAWDRSAGTTAARISQAIEGVETLAGKEVTIAVLAYATTPGISLGLRLDQDFGTGGSPSAVVPGTQGSVNLPSSSVGLVPLFFKTTLASIAGKALGSNGNDCLILNIDSPASGAFGIRILDVAVVEGDATTEGDGVFGSRNRAVETALCQRYYERTSTSFTIFSGQVASGATYYVSVLFRAQKRTVPTMSVLEGARSGFPLDGITPSGNIDGSVFYKAANANGAGYFQFTWSADAELI